MMEYFSDGRSIQPQRLGRPVVEPNSLPSLRINSPSSSSQLCGKRPAANARAIRLEDPEYLSDVTRCNTQAGTRARRNRIRARNKRITSEIDIEQCTLSTLRQNSWIRSSVPDSKNIRFQSAGTASRNATESKNCVSRSFQL